MGLLLLIAFLVWLPSEVKAPSIFAQRETENLVILEGNSLKGSFIPISSENGNFKGKVAIKNEIMELVRDKFPELYDIVACESSFRPDVCSYVGCNYGMGLIQVIPSSLELCEKELNRKLNPFNSLDNLECGKILYQIQGLKAWKSSQQCWQNY